MISLGQFKECYPKCKNPIDMTTALNDILPKYNITTPEQISMFLAQCGHESNDFNTLQENLNYSAEGLQKTFPKYFKTAAIAAQYERCPEKIADRVYASRMGNGAESSGDGWKYRGRGLIQLTGHDNYEAFAKYIKRDISALPEYLVTIHGAVESAAWFWVINNLNKLSNSVEETTKRINGGLVGLNSRLACFDKCKSVIS